MRERVKCASNIYYLSLLFPSGDVKFGFVSPRKAMSLCNYHTCFTCKNESQIISPKLLQEENWTDKREPNVPSEQKKVFPQSAQEIRNPKHQTLGKRGFSRGLEKLGRSKLREATLQCCEKMMRMGRGRDGGGDRWRRSQDTDAAQMKDWGGSTETGLVSSPLASVWTVLLPV